MAVPRYTNLSLKNFRGFKKATEIRLAPLTFLVGPNSSGKSTISDSLLFLSQSRFLPSFLESSLIPIWIGSLIDLGTFEDTVFRHNLNLELSIGVDVSLDPSTSSYRLSDDDHLIGFEFKIRQPRSGSTAQLREIRVCDRLTQECLIVKLLGGPQAVLIISVDQLSAQIRLSREWEIGRAFHRISQIAAELVSKQRERLRGKRAGWKRIIRHLVATSNYERFVFGTSRVSSGRSGPQRWYVPQQQPEPREAWYDDPLRTLYDSLSPEIIEESKDFIPSPRRRRQTRRPLSVDQLLKDLEIGDRITVKDYTAYHSIIYVRDNIVGAESNIKDVGYGASQILPVIAACTSPSSSLLVIEQPEVHLHPRAQGKISEILAEVSKRRQVLIETHSPHMINRARILVASGELDCANIAINYVFRDSRGSHVHHIPIDRNGDFGAKWPEGFFDERYEDTMTLLNLKNKNMT